MTEFNAWTQPWIPVARRDNTSTTLSLRDALLCLHDLKDFGDGLTPLDLDSMYRFLGAVVGVVSRWIDDEWRDDWAIPAHAVNSFGDRFGKRFELFGEKPFLQRWDRSAADIEACVTAKKPLEAILNPIEQLHPHEPGGSSSQWAIRHDSRDVNDLATITLLLVTSWFQTKNGNGRDLWGEKATKGSASTWHTNPMAVYYTNQESLAKTLFANIPEEWINRTDLPVFLSRELPDDFGVSPRESVSRFTYAKTLPLIYRKDGRLVGFVVGPDSTITVPPLGADEKTSLGVIHEHDHTRLYLEKMSKSGGPPKPRGSFGGRLTSTEGFERWFRADNGISKAIQSWQGIPRTLVPSESDLANWNLSVFSETTDGKGTRNWVAWDRMPANFATAKGMTLSAIQTLFEFSSECRKCFYTCGRIATGEAKDVPAFVVGQSAFYTSIMPIIAELASEINRTDTADLRKYAARVRAAAFTEFDVTSRPFLTPTRVASVAKARNQFRKNVGSVFAKKFPELNPAASKEAS